MARTITSLACALSLSACVESDPGTSAGASETSVIPGDGDPGDGDPGDGDPGDGDPGDGDGESSTGLKWDLGEFDSPPSIEEVPPWLVNMNRLQANGPIYLNHIDIETGDATPICELIDAATQQPVTTQGPSLTFTRDDRLMASFGSYLSEILLPGCEVVYIGDIGYSGVAGILPDEGNELYGISATSDVLLHIDTGTGAGMPIGNLGQDWGNHGGTWIEADQEILGLSGNDNSLYDIDQNSGMVALLAALGVNFTSVGFEFHPLTEQLYACTGDGNLYRIEDDFSVTNVGPTGLYGQCSNLGAPWSTNVQLPQL